MDDKYENILMRELEKWHAADYRWSVCVPWFSLKIFSNTPHHRRGILIKYPLENQPTSHEDKLKIDLT